MRQWRQFRMNKPVARLIVAERELGWYRGRALRVQHLLDLRACARTHAILPI